MAPLGQYNTGCVSAFLFLEDMHTDLDNCLYQVPHSLDRPTLILIFVFLFLVLLLLAWCWYTLTRRTILSKLRNLPSFSIHRDLETMYDKEFRIKRATDEDRRYRSITSQIEPQGNTRKITIVENLDQVPRRPPDHGRWGGLIGRQRDRFRRISHRNWWMSAPTRNPVDEVSIAPVRLPADRDSMSSLHLDDLPPRTYAG